MGFPRFQNAGGATDPDVPALVRRARAGDVRAFEELVQRYQRPLMGYLTHLVQSDAEDLAQESLWKAHGSLATLKSPEAFPGWLFAIARNLALAALARRRSSVPVDKFLADSTSEQAERRERATELARALAALDRDNRDLLLLRYFAGLEPETIAGLLDAPADRTRARLAYARKLLRCELIRRGGW
jgi:RNA polymerase sigma-70 factor (ECF subfamily)